MAKKLIIAEKPSLARNIISAIGKSDFENKRGYYESPNYVVTWAFGHLFSLCDIEDYDEDEYEDVSTKGWSLSDIPFYPEKFKFTLRKDLKSKKVDSGVREQFETIKNLINRSDVDGIVNAGDSDREGEIIIRIILRYAECKKTVYRLWMPDQTIQTIKAALNDLPLDKEYDSLANEGYARTFIDWLYGVNLTRYSTVRCGCLLRVGRVISPIVQAIYEREMEIRNFVAETYYNVSSHEKTNGEKLDLTSSHKFDKDQKEDAEKYKDLLNSQKLKAIVKESKSEKKTIPPGKLYSLSKLQGVLGRKFGMKPNQSLSIIQSLYERGFVTYPRTNTEYLSEAEKGKFSTIVTTIENMGYKVKFKDSKSIFDSSKIESHSALTPTFNIPEKSELSDAEYKVYQTIFSRFLAVFCSEPCVVNRTELIVGIGSVEDISAKGDVIIEKGWTQYDEYTGKEKVLPKLSVGDRVNVDFSVEEKKTTAPGRYTTDSFYKYLKNPFRKEDATDDEEYKAMFSGVELGTEATRTSIIDNAINSGYISLRENKYYLEDGGERYIEALSGLGVLMEKQKTAELGMLLKKVYRGESGINNAIAIVEGEITSLINKSKERSVGKVENKIGKCPKCGSAVTEMSKSYSCSNKDCKFALWKDNKYFSSIGAKMTESTASLLLKDGKVFMKNLKSKSGKKYSATIIADFSDVYPKYSMEFGDGQNSEATTSESTDMLCPLCKKSIVKTSFGWGCSGYKESRCKFLVGEKIAEKKISERMVRDLLKKGETNMYSGFKSKSGKEFSARLVLSKEGKVEFSFE